MSAIDTTFETLRSQGRKAFLPFITAGDPDLEFTGKVLKELVARGASICELGIPYSDPIADGPVIQASYTRVLDQKQKLGQILEAATSWTAELSAPLVSMVSYSIIHRQGLENYVARAKAAGIAGAIVPDLLVEESAEFSALCQREDFSLIQLVTPTTPRDRALKICETSTGFLYFVSVTGITGERTELPPEVVDQVGWLKERTDLPICIGFGISQPEHVKMLAPVADGLIVGSAIVRKIAEVEEKGEAAVLAEIGDLVDELTAAMDS
ncbi:MAG: tryptophan synthase subunit alpha [Planctomycetaceae bacterium]|nr:tryptophan synthase subunit alpha [Planctomycetaceae bacterium]|tara:strand:- start:16432 stop:17235 length:804 start_codon:yes stop_codon:yes gene_type:complete